ncbi:MAG: hypothetical protein ACOCYN_03925 [Planctomycetota bacterium]
MTGFVGREAPIPFQSPNATAPLAFRHQDPDTVVLGKRMEDHLRFAVCYWRNFVWPGNGPFGGPIFERR